MLQVWLNDRVWVCVSSDLGQIKNCPVCRHAHCCLVFISHHSVLTLLLSNICSYLIVGSPVWIMLPTYIIMYMLLKNDLEDFAPQVRVNQCSNPWPLDHEQNISCPWDAHLYHWAFRELVEMGLLYLLRMHANELGQYALLDCDVNKMQKLYHSRLRSTMKTASCRQKKTIPD